MQIQFLGCCQPNDFILSGDISIDTNKMPLDLPAFINRHLVYKRTVDYEDGKELFELIDMAKNWFAEQNEKFGSALVEVPIPVKIVGDLHGQFFDLQRIFFSNGLPDRERYLFLGDYVDRGPSSVECIALLLALKLCAPDMIFLLRGNHECPCVNKTYGFNEELTKRFDAKVGAKLYAGFNSLFAHFPLAALIRGRILCMHGGISPKLESLDDIRRIKLPINDPASDTLEEDLLWSDPVPDLEGFEFNKSREASVQFGEDTVEDICDRLGLDFIVRGHQLMPNGFGFFANGRLITIFSAPKYQKNMNRGCLLSVDEQMNINFLLMNPVKSSDKAGEEHFRTTFAEARAESMSKSSSCAEPPSEVFAEPTETDHAAKSTRSKTRPRCRLQ